jgi:integrase/recombinase XerD
MERFLRNSQTVLRLRRSPLGQYLDLYASQLEEQGYSSTTAYLLIRVAGGFSQWLKRKNIAIHFITNEVAIRYLSCRARSHRPSGSEAAALKRMLNILYEEGVIRKPIVVQTQANQFTLEFASYLRDERALSESTIKRYTGIVSSFLNQRYLDGPVDLSNLRAKDVIFFVTKEATRIGTKSSRNVTNGLRSFLKYAEYQGHTSAALATSVPTVANWSDTGIPRALPAEQVEKIFNRCNRDTATGSRDYAILQLLARLGLRACEVAGLKLEDIDWTVSAIVVRGKGGKKKQLPLPAEVGKAIAEYLQNWRVQSLDRSVFLRHRAPIVGFSHPGAIGLIVGRALARAKIDCTTKGSHQFRHGLATEMLRRGSSLADIGEILGHASPRTTQIYAKVDIDSLRRLAISWPGGAK